MTQDPRDIIDLEHIVRGVAAKSGQDIKAVKPICDALLASISNELKNGKTVRLADFGTFSVPKKTKRK
jgi:nucleoid DNA-binding protein